MEEQTLQKNETISEIAGNKRKFNNSKVRISFAGMQNTMSN